MNDLIIAGTTLGVSLAKPSQAFGYLYLKRSVSSGEEKKVKVLKNAIRAGLSRKK